MAKDLVRTRRYVKKFILMRANIQAVSLKIQTLKSNDAMAQAMKGVTRAMTAMNKQARLLAQPSNRMQKMITMYLPTTIPTSDILVETCAQCFLRMRN